MAHFDQLVTFVYCRDLEASTAFYRDLLGLPQVLDQGGCRLFRVSRDGFLGVCRCSESRPVSPDGVIVTFVADDVEERCARLREAGAVFEKEPAYNPDYDITHAFLRDPDGYLLEIQRFESPDWPRSDA